MMEREKGTQKDADDYDESGGYFMICGRFTKRPYNLCNPYICLTCPRIRRLADRDPGLYRHTFNRDAKFCK
jgi:hypothetical protein